MSIDAQSSNLTESKLTDWITDWMCRELKLTEAPRDLTKSFVSYRMDSVHALMLVGDLEDYLGRPLAPTLAWDHPTIEALVRYLAQDSEAPAASGAAATDSEILNRLDALSEEEIDRLLRERLQDVQDS